MSPGLAPAAPGASQRGGDPRHDQVYVEATRLCFHEALGAALLTSPVVLRWGGAPGRVHGLHGQFLFCLP